jgi:hypothetical protein
MRVEDHLFCPPMIWLSGVEQPGFLLAWLWTEKTAQWQAVVTWLWRWFLTDR